jgi:hypothetical protein
MTYKGSGAGVHGDSRFNARRANGRNGLNRHDTQYVKFERDAGRRLRKLPSHGRRRKGPVHAPIMPPAGRLARRTIGFSLLAVIIVFLLTATIAASGLLAGPAQRMAGETLQRMVPEGHSLVLGNTDVRLSWPPSLAVTFDAVSLAPSPDADPVAMMNRLAVRIDPLSLAGDNPRIAGITVEGARIDRAAMAALDAGNDGAPGTPFGLSGVPERFDALFAGLRRWGAIHLHQEGGLRLAIADSAILMGEGGMVSTFSIDHLAGRADGRGNAAFEGEIAFDGSRSAVSGELNVPGAAQPSEPAQLTLAVDAMPFPWRRLPTLFSEVAADHEPGADRPPVPTQTVLELVHAPGEGSGNVLRATLAPQDLTLKLGADDFVPLGGEIVADYGFEDRVLSIEPQQWSLGRSTFELSVRMRDAVGADTAPAGGAAALEFDAIANRGRLSPADSPEQSLRFAARARGTFDPAERLLRFTDMEMQSDAGGARAEGQVSFYAPAPSAVFQMDIEDMSVAGLKQFWPAPVARGARRWVLDNLAGGRVVSGRFDIVEPLRRRVPGTNRRVLGDTAIALEVEGVRFDIAGDLPPMRDAVGRIEHSDQTTRMLLRSGTVFLPSGRTAEASDGVMVIQPENDDGLVGADVNVRVRGTAAALGEIIAHRPINAMQYRAYDPDDLSGDVDAQIAIGLFLNSGEDGPRPDWTVEMDLSDAAIAEPIDGALLTGLDGAVSVTPERADLDLTGAIDGLPADIAMTIPFSSEIEAARSITLRLDDAARETFAPGLDVLLRGPTPLELEGTGAAFDVSADLTSAELVLPWIGWSKGAGVGAEATFHLLLDGETAVLDKFNLTGGPFGAEGRIAVDGNGLSRARFGALRLNEGDSVSVDVRREGAGYTVNVEGRAVDARALIRHVRRQMQQSGDRGGDNTPVTVSASLGMVRGFRGVEMRDVRTELSIRNGGVENLSITGTSDTGMPFSVAIRGQGAERRVRIEALDAGGFLRFLDLYGQISGGVLNASLSGGAGGQLSGPVQLTDFRVFDEPKLSQLVSTRGDGTASLSEAVRRDIDTREVVFDVAQANAVFAPGGLSIGQGIVRGPLVGFALQGQVYDSDGEMRMTGTFMPAYGVNSLFSEIPILGLFLGNGRERGLIGVTFKLEGSFEQPQITVNPLSVIAPGLFRSIFEFR